MKAFKDLLSQTIVYGLSSILPRLLNFLLVPLYTRILGFEEYGKVSLVYAYTGIALVLLTYGTETGYFRFSKDSKNQKRLFSTLFSCLLMTTFIFLILGIGFRDLWAQLMSIGEHPDFVIMLVLIIFSDVIASIPFARLRYLNKAFVFFKIKMINVGTNVLLNVVFLMFIPWLLKQGIEVPFYDADYNVGYIFLSNVIASFLGLLILLKTIEFSLKDFDTALLKKVLLYSAPILFTGVMSQMNELVDRILIEHLVPGDDGMAQTGIYSANLKIAVLMTLFIQGYRYAADPFFFKFAGEKDAKFVYAETTRYFIAFCMFIYVGMISFLDIVKNFIGSSFQDTSVVPAMLLSNMMLGILFNLAVWYKVTNKTKYGMVIAGFGVLITLVFNIVFVPIYGYAASAWTHLACNTGMVILSYFLMLKFYRIDYDLKRILGFMFTGLIFSYITLKIDFNYLLLKYLTVFIILLVYLVLFVKTEKIDKKLKTYIHARRKNC